MEVRRLNHRATTSHRRYQKYYIPCFTVDSKEKEDLSNRDTAQLFDVRHEKKDFKVFVVLIPKEGLVGGALPILILVWHRLKICNALPSQIITCSRCHTKRRIGEAPPTNPSFGMTMTKKLRSVFSWCVSFYLIQSSWIVKLTKFTPCKCEVVFHSEMLDQTIYSPSRTFRVSWVVGVSTLWQSIVSKINKQSENFSVTAFPWFQQVRDLSIMSIYQLNCNNSNWLKSKTYLWRIGDQI